MSLDYVLKEASPDENWDTIVDKSLNGTIFSKSDYLKNSGANYKLYYCYKKEAIRAAVAVILSDDSKDLILDDFVIYNGLMYNEPSNKQNQAQQYSEHHKIQGFVAEQLAALYKNIQLSLHPSIIDIRPFLWYNYHEDLPQYDSEVRYTTYIDISDFRRSTELEKISLFDKTSVSRRQQVRYAIRKNYKTLEIKDSGLLVALYEKTMERQGIAVEWQKLKRMQTLIDNLVALGTGKMYGSYDELNELGSIAFFSWDNKRAYYIFGANDPEKRDGHSGTAVLWDAFYDLSEKHGIREVDLEGINSPDRGWFKLSFGGDIIPYYLIGMSR